MNNSTVYQQSSKFILPIALLPVIDAIMGMFYELMNSNLGGVSYFQIYRIFTLAFLVLAILLSSKGTGGYGRTVFRFALFVVSLLFLFVVKEYAETSRFPSISTVAYSKILFFILLWSAVTRQARGMRDAMIFLRGLVGAGIIMTLSVLYSILTGSNAVYNEDIVGPIIATAGNFKSGKTISGPLVVAAIAAMYLYRSRRRTIGSFIAAAFIGAAISTLNRTGMLAIALMCAWIVFWGIRYNKQSSRSTILFIIILAIGAVAYGQILGFESIISRWSDVSSAGANLGAAGSGRAGLWMVTIEWFSQANLLDKLLGAGYQGMFKVNYYYTGNPMIHSHSDLFDLLLIGGVSGITIWMLFFSTIRRMSILAWNKSRSLEYALYWAIVVVLFTYSLFTSAFYGPNVMGAFIIGMGAFIAIAKEKASCLETRAVPVVPTGWTS